MGQAEADRILRGKSSVSAAVRTEGGALRIDRIVLENPQVSVRATGRTGGTGREVDIAAKLADLGLLAAGVSGAVDRDGQGGGTGRCDAA